ncbi:copper resistance CopC family protein [Micromonospora antibiotica]|uniref:Copper resistance protein CopC n=1 Tax=Micromonospora antibiotica TaxID=2807623 RepID=A0ABS3V4M5_9ACTN|nr:copper resistance CopC family protein [Micromonospora antibiotica]MBO4160568.1 copper resistance protein CopC [Micromonospora antibiotica]
MITSTCRLAAALLATVLALLVAATPAWAHNSLTSASPAREATLSRAPTEITLEFLARLDPAFTTIVLTDGTKRRVPTGDPVVDGTKSTVQVTDTLPNGTYTVAYRVVSADGHPVQGSYPFTVADPAAPTVAPSTASAAPATAAAPAGDDDGRGTVLGVAGGAVAALAVAAGALRWRRRSTRR